MPGFTNSTPPTLENITEIANITQPLEFFAKVNTNIYDGWLYFVLLCILWAILWRKLQVRQDLPLTHLMTSGMVVTILALLIRGIEVSVSGNMLLLLEDKQMYIFPLVTFVLALLLYWTKD